MEVRNLPGRKTVAFCGTRSVPANYGGFETTVDEISRRFAENGYDAVVYCRKSSYAGKALKYHQGRSYEPKAHDTTDRRMNWVGYKVHLVTKVATRDLPNLITGVRTTVANSQEASADRGDRLPVRSTDGHRGNILARA